MKAFKNLKELEKDIRENGTDDFYNINGFIYTMDYYDSTGELITYGNAKNRLGFRVETSNRYGVNKFKDAVITEQQNTSLRNDISYYE